VRTVNAGILTIVKEEQRTFKEQEILTFTQLTDIAYVQPTIIKNDNSKDYASGQ